MVNVFEEEFSASLTYFQIKLIFYFMLKGTVSVQTAPLPGMYTRVVALKSQNAGLRVLLAVGGAGRSIDAFRAACETPATRTTFASNVISFLRAQRLDGLDVDWEYPEGYKSKFTLLLAVSCCWWWDANKIFFLNWR